MNMKKITTIFIIITVVVIVVGLAFTELYLKSKNPPTPTQVTSPQLQIPTTTPFPFVPAVIKQAVIEQLPYETDEFLIEYLQKSDLIYVTIKGDAYVLNHRAAIKWLLDQQVPAPTNNSQIRFIFTNYRGN